MTRYRDLGLTVGQLPPGPLNAITDVVGVRVGMTTLIEGEGPLVVGQGPVRTGVTVVVPHPGIVEHPLFAGTHTLNGNGEMTGLEWVRESGHLTTPIGITNTHSVGVVRDALVSFETAARDARSSYWALPVAAETYDGALNDINGMHVRTEHVYAAIEAAVDGPVPEGAVGGGTGMICHEFKGGTGTASRVVEAGFTVGALVQANHGDRDHLMVDGVPVGRELPSHGDPLRVGRGGGDRAGGRGFDHRRARHRRSAAPPPARPARAARGPRRSRARAAPAATRAATSSSPSRPATPTVSRNYKLEGPSQAVEVTMLPDAGITALFWAAIEATEEAILNAMVAAPTLTGRDGITAHALPHDDLVAIMTKYGRGPA